MEISYKDRVVFVTGAGSGIGAAIARAFCREGARTIFVDIDRDRLERVVDGCGGLARPAQCDVSSRGEVEKVFQEVERTYGLLHVLVNCAAVIEGGWITEIKEEGLERTIDINIKGYIHTTTCAVPLMRKAGYGRIIYLNSSSGLKASSGLGLYSASKYFDRGFAISTALEVGKDNITANSVCPSDVYPEGELEAKSWRDSSLLDISLEKEGVDALEELIEKRREKNPMKRHCTAEDIVNLVLFLASEQAGFINGQSIGLNGGQLPY
jgi:NAD(P)-dependent dehydrogenase (short-subunit alcohol dehydrogenase family)